MATFLEIDPDNFDYDRYHELVGARMHKVDYTPPAELRSSLAKGKLAAWIVTDKKGDWLGWCALRLHHNKYHDPAHHVWGIVTFDENVNKSLFGLGMHMMRFLLAYAGATPVTVSIRPDNPASLAIARRLRFREIAPVSHWRQFVYIPAGLSS